MRCAVCGSRDPHQLLRPSLEFISLVAEMDSCMDDYQQSPLPSVPVSIGFYVGTSIVALLALGQRARIACQRPGGATRPAFGLAAEHIIAELASILLVLNIPKIICYTGFRYGMRSAKGDELACQTQSESFGGVPLPSVFISLPLILIVLFNEVRLCSRHKLARLLSDTLASRGRWSGNALGSGDTGLAGSGAEGVATSLIAAAAAGSSGTGVTGTGTTETDATPASSATGMTGTGSKSAVLRVLSLPVYRGTYVAPVLQALRTLPGVDAVQMHAADAFSTVLQPESDAWLATNVRLEGESGSVIVTRTDFVSVPLPDASVDLVFIPATRALPLGRAAGRDASEQLKAAELAVLLAECLRVLKPGGAIAATAFAHFSLGAWEEALRAAGFSDVATEKQWVWLSFVPSRLCVALKPGGVGGGVLRAASSVSTVRVAGSSSTAVVVPSLAHSSSGSAVEASATVPMEAATAKGKDKERSVGALTVRLLEDVHADASEALRSVTMDPPPTADEARRTLASARLTRSLELPPARSWCPAGRLWRLRDALLAAAGLVFAGVVAATVIYFDSLARVPGFVSWSWTAGALTLSIVQQVPVALYFMAVDLSHFVGETIDAAASSARAAAAAATAGRRLSAGASRSGVPSLSGSATAAPVPAALAAAAAAAAGTHSAVHISGSAASRESLASGRESLLSRPTSLAESRAAALSARVAARAHLAAATAAEGDAQSTRAVLRHFMSEMWTAALGLTVFQLITWAPGFVLNCTLLKLGASQSTANTATLIATILVFSLIIPVGRRLYAWHKARKERQLRDEEAAAAAEAAAEAEPADADDDDSTALLHGRDARSGLPAVAVVVPS